MFRPAALFAAIGTALVSVMFLVNNAIPIFRNLNSVSNMETAIFLFTTIVPSLVWTVYFLACARSRGPHVPALLAWVTLVVAVATPTLYLLRQQVPYFSLRASDSWVYLFTGILLPLAWAILVFCSRRPDTKAPRAFAKTALLLTVLSAYPEVSGSIYVLTQAATGLLAATWHSDPWQAFWRLLAIPFIRDFYWASQIFVLIVWAALDSLRPARYKN